MLAHIWVRAMGVCNLGLPLRVPDAGCPCCWCRRLNLSMTGKDVGKGLDWTFAVFGVATFQSCPFMWHSDGWFLERWCPASLVSHLCGSLLSSDVGHTVKTAVERFIIIFVWTELLGNNQTKRAEKLGKMKKKRRKKHRKVSHPRFACIFHFPRRSYFCATKTLCHRALCVPCATCRTLRNLYVTVFPTTTVLLWNIGITVLVSVWSAHYMVHCLWLIVDTLCLCIEPWC